MREFAPNKSHPSDGELAAYIDGALDATEAARVADHLADCEDCYFVYSETLQFQLEPEPGKVVQFPSREERRPRFWWLAAAAAILVVALGSWYVYRAVLPGSPPQLTVAEITPDLRKRPVQDLLWDHNRYRGEGEAETEVARQSFQVGALLVDFHLSAQAGSAEQASEVLRTIGSVVGQVSLMEKGVSKRILSEANQIDPGTNPTTALRSLPSVADQAPTTEEELRDSVLFPEYIDFGKWTEAGRIAAKTKDSKFFENDQNRRFLSYALKKWDPEKPEEVRHQLEEIQRIWDRGGFDSKGFESLAGHFQAILDQYEFRS